MATTSPDNNPSNSFELIRPRSDSDWDRYFDLRWRVLRAPWDQPRGSERDPLDPDAFHLMLADSARKPVAVGRLHFNSPEEAQVRYMAVDEFGRAQGFGTRILQGLESHAWSNGASRIVLNARAEAVNFYLRHGYQVEGPAETLFGTVRHSRMRKELHKS